MQIIKTAALSAGLPEESVIEDTKGKAEPLQPLPRMEVGWMPGALAYAGRRIARLARKNPDTEQVVRWAAYESTLVVRCDVERQWLTTGAGPAGPCSTCSRARSGQAHTTPAPR